VEQPAETVDTGFGSVTIIPPDKKPAAGNGGAFGMDVGLGASQPVVEVAQNTSPLAPQPTMNSEADTGPAEESDADLDARVAGLLQR
jgi:hypothetical protein